MIFSVGLTLLEVVVVVAFLFLSMSELTLIDDIIDEGSVCVICSGILMNEK